MSIASVDDSLVRVQPDSLAQVVLADVLDELVILIAFHEREDFGSGVEFEHLFSSSCLVFGLVAAQRVGT